MTSNRFVRLTTVTGVLCALLALPTATLAAQRTFVASYGSDASPTCSLAAPCRGFAAAIAQTAVGGEVIALDSAGYGGATITQSVSIVAPAGVYAGVSVMAGDGITINAGASHVHLRGLRITGLGGARGIVVTSVGFLDIANIEVNGFTRGLDFAAPGARLVVADSSFSSNPGDGAYVQSAGARSFATFLRSRFDRNGNGVVIIGNTFATISESSASHTQGGSAFYVNQGAVANIADCSISGSDTYGYDYGIFVDAGSMGSVTRCKITGASYGVLGYGAGTKIAVSDTTIIAVGGGSGAGITASAGATGTVERCTVSGSQHGYSVGAGNSVLSVSNSMAADNVVDAFYAYAAGSTIYSRSNNTVRGNPSVWTGAGTFTTFAPE